VDYIFGDASAWFGECKSKDKFRIEQRISDVDVGTMASSGGGSITASSRTYNTDTAWYVIDHSTVSYSQYQHLIRNIF
jgi:pectinesterase